MKSIKLVLSSTVALALPALALAQMQPTAPGGPGVTVGSLQDVIRSLEMAMGLIFGAIAVICFLVAGILFLTSQGNPDSITKARQAFMYGIVGVVIGIIAFSIVAIVASVVSGGSV